MPRSSLQRAAALALVLGSAVGGPAACVLDWDPSHRATATGGTTGTPPSCTGFTCDCAADTCKCLGGSCTLVCAKDAGTCNVECAGGGCTIDCNGVAGCHVSCPGGGCHCTGISGAACPP